MARFRSFSQVSDARLPPPITAGAITTGWPAYARFAAFVRDEYAPRGRTALSITALPGGDRRYADLIYARTTTRMSADEIHKLGLSEVERIQEQMTAIAKQQGFRDGGGQFMSIFALNPNSVYRDSI